jgi:hypothetical protein
MLPRASVLVKKKKDSDGSDAFLLSVARGSIRICGLRFPQYLEDSGFQGIVRKQGASAYVRSYFFDFFGYFRGMGLHSIIHFDSSKITYKFAKKKHLARE